MRDKEILAEVDLAQLLSELARDIDNIADRLRHLPYSAVEDQLLRLRAQLDQALIAGMAIPIGEPEVALRLIELIHNGEWR